MAGFVLSFAGLMLSSASHFVLRSTPLTALGVSTTILGVISFAFSSGQTKILPEASEILLESSLNNVSALIEEIGLASRAIYLPSSIAGGKPQVLIPLHINPDPPKPESLLPKRFIVKYSPNPEAMGILITTPGSTIARLSGSKPSPAIGDLEMTLSSVLTDKLDLADAVKVNTAGESIIVEASNLRLKCENMRIYKCLGSIFASIVASVVTEALDKPVIIEREAYEKNRGIIELRAFQ